MIRFDSLKDLHDKLAEIELLKNKIQLCNDENPLMAEANVITTDNYKIRSSIS